MQREFPLHFNYETNKQYLRNYYFSTQTSNYFLFLYNLFMTIKKITDYLKSLYPLSKAEKWDNCGLIFGNPKKIVSKALVALDLTTEVFNEALEKDAEIIIVHHPFIFDKENLEEELQFNDYKKKLINRIDNTGMAVYVMHTNFDVAIKGMKQATVDLLSLDPTNEKLDYGVVFKTSMDLLDMKKFIKEKYGFSQSITNAPNDFEISKIAVLPGTGNLKDILKAKEYGVNLIVTADIKWSTWVTLKEEKIFALQIPHQMEKVMIAKVKEDLIKLNGIKVATYIERIIK